MKLEEFIEKVEKINEYISDKKDLIENINFKNLNTKYNEVIESLTRINNEKTSYREKNIVEQYIEKNSNKINSVYIKGPLIEEEDIKDLEKILGSLLDEIERLKYLRIFNESNTIIVGGNGSGKSSLASYFKESDADGIIVIPAQKILFYIENPEVSSANEKDIRKIQKNNFNDKSYKKDYDVSNKVSQLSKVFSYHISAIINELAKAGADKLVKNKDSETKYIKLLEIWRKFYSDIEFRYDMNKRKLVPEKNGKEYDLNSMSEGEKVTLFYILITLFAPRDAYIIVDEPETFLNPSMYNRLWYLLEEYRKDCTFIYISHHLEFISSRNAHNIYWCKKYDGNKNWEIKEISGELGDIPKELVIELLGARKNILFCEGSRESLDYKVYTLLFENQVVVVPVGGHKDVINNTKAYNNSKLFDGEAYGIIDKDYHSKEALENYEQNKIYHLEFNEIEMFLITNEILEYVLTNTYAPDIASSFMQKFKIEVINEIQKKKDYIINESIKFHIDEKNFTIDSKQLKSKLKLKDAKSKSVKYNEKNIKEYFCNLIDDININEKIKELENKISTLLVEENKYEEIVEENKYEEALKVSNLKYLFNSKTNEAFELNYKLACISKIQDNKDLRKTLRDKYFSKLFSSIVAND